MKIKYQISSQASTVGNSVNLKFLIKQKKNFTRRALESDDDDDDDLKILKIIEKVKQKVFIKPIKAKSNK